MGSLSDYAENELLDHILGEGAYSPPANTYLALVTADPDDTVDATFMTANEVATADTGYARQTISWDAASGRAIATDAACTFTQSGGTGFGTIKGACIMDGDTEGAGNCLGWTLVDNKTVGVGETYTVDTGDLTVTVDASGAGGGLKTTFVTELLNWLFDGGAMTTPNGTTAPHVALFTANPSDSANGTEVVVGTSSYARIQDTFSTAVGGASDNDTQLDFTASGDAFGTVTGAGLMKSGTETTPDCMFWADFSSDAVIGDGDTLRIVAGGFDVALT